MAARDCDSILKCSAGLLGIENCNNVYWCRPRHVNLCNSRFGSVTTVVELDEAELICYRWWWYYFIWCDLTLLSNRTQKIGKKSAPSNFTSEVTLIEVQLHIKISFWYSSRMSNMFEQFWAILERFLLVSGCRSNWQVSLIFWC